MMHCIGFDRGRGDVLVRRRFGVGSTKRALTNTAFAIVMPFFTEDRNWGLAGHTFGLITTIHLAFTVQVRNCYIILTMAHTFDTL